MDRFLPPADAQVFLGRLTRLDPDALVRLRPSAPGRVALWARLPWGVLVVREVDADPPGDATVGAAALLAASQEGSPVPGFPGIGQPSSGKGRPARRDAEWRWPLPPGAGTVVEEIPSAALREVAQAAAGTLREVTTTGLAGRPVGVRVLREALLDHVPIVVEPADGARVEVPQRLVQAVVRMGFLGAADTPVRVREAHRWVGLVARYGSAWLPPAAGPLSVRPAARPA